MLPFPGMDIPVRTNEIVAKSAFLSGLNEDERQAVILAAHLSHKSQGELFFHQGEPATHFYILIEGQVKLNQITPEGHQIIINYFGPGDGFGIIVVLSQMDYPVEAEAVEEAPSTSATSARSRGRS